MPVRVTLSNPGGGRAAGGGEGASLNGRAHPPKGNLSLGVFGEREAQAAATLPVSAGPPRRNLKEGRERRPLEKRRRRKETGEKKTAQVLLQEGNHQVLLRFFFPETLR